MNELCDHLFPCRRGNHGPSCHRGNQHFFVFRQLTIVARTRPSTAGRRSAGFNSLSCLLYGLLETTAPPPGKQSLHQQCPPYRYPSVPFPEILCICQKGRHLPKFWAQQLISPGSEIHRDRLLDVDDARFSSAWSASHAASGNRPRSGLDFVGR